MRERIWQAFPKRNGRNQGKGYQHDFPGRHDFPKSCIDGGKAGRGKSAVVPACTKEESKARAL